MCNDYEQHLKWIEYSELMQKLALGLSIDDGPGDLPQADDIRVNDTAPVMRAQGNVVVLQQMKWSFPAPRPGGKPAFNFRSEGQHFTKEQRVIIPASAFLSSPAPRAPRANGGSA